MGESMESQPLFWKRFFFSFFFRPDECSSLENTFDLKKRINSSQNSRVPVHYIGTCRERPGTPPKTSYE